MALTAATTLRRATAASFWLAVAASVGLAGAASAREPPSSRLPAMALLAEAWSASPEVARAEADVAAAEAEVVRLGVVLPNPELQASGRTDVMFQAEGELDAELGLVQELAWPAARLSRLEGTERAVRAARLRRALARLDVAARVEAAAASLRAAADAALLRADMARLARALAEAASRRAAAGAVGTVESTLARADAALAESARADADAAVITARASLCALLGRDGCAQLEDQVTWPDPPALPTLPAPPALAARADVGAAALDVEAARRALAGAELDRIPTASLGLSVGVDRTAIPAPGVAAPLVDFDQLGGINLSITLPIWDWRAGEIARARADLARAGADLLAQRRAATSSVASALARLEAAAFADERLAAVDGAVAAALTDVERASLAGALPLDVALATRDRLLRVRLERVEARRRRVEAHAAALQAFADPRIIGIDVSP